jgi:hypothetical protein
MIKFYSGIGSRVTPEPVLEEMRAIASHLVGRNFILRSGGADGADTAFEQGSAGYAEIFLPWSGFNRRTQGYVVDNPEAEVIASKHHPNWGACSIGARKLHTRNVLQVLGMDLQTPSEFVICWTPDGRRGGGTGQALRIAESYNIPIFDLAVHVDREELLQLMETL